MGVLIKQQNTNQRCCIIDEFSQRTGISKKLLSHQPPQKSYPKKQIIKPKKRENVESSAHTPYFPSYEPGGYFIADNSKTNPTQKKQISKKRSSSKTSIKSLNFLKNALKIHAKFKNLQTPLKSKIILYLKSK